MCFWSKRMLLITHSSQHTLKQTANFFSSANQTSPVGAWSRFRCTRDRPYVPWKLFTSGTSVIRVSSYSSVLGRSFSARQHQPPVPSRSRGRRRMRWNYAEFFHPWIAAVVEPPPATSVNVWVPVGCFSLRFQAVSGTASTQNERPSSRSPRHPIDSGSPLHSPRSNADHRISRFVFRTVR